MRRLEAECDRSGAPLEVITEEALDAYLRCCEAGQKRHVHGVGCRWDGLAYVCPDEEQP